METAEKLANQGWHISNEGFDQLTNSGTVKDLRAIVDRALDADLKDVGRPILSLEINKNKIQQLVLQIQKIRNISAPKSNEDSQAAPRMLKLILTDGHTYCQGIEIGNLPFLSQAKTIPGMKLLIKGATVSCGYIFLQPNTCSLLGGKVTALYEKWEINKSISKHTRVSSYDGDGPPPWVNFGQKILSPLDIQAFKSLENKNKEQVKQNSEFEVQRQDAISEAASGAVKKVFGGGVKQSIQVQENRKANFNKSRSTQEKERTNGRKVKRDLKDDDKPQKPSEKVSLFDFLEDKLGDTGNSNKHKNADDYANNDISQNRAPRFQNPNYNSNYKNYNKQAPKFNSISGYNASHNQSLPQNHYRNNISSNYQQNKYQNSPSQPQSLPMESHNVSNVHSLSSNLERMSVNSQFASRSLKQHLNLGARTGNSEISNVQRNRNEHTNSSNVESPSAWPWKVGDQCMAKYWEDNKYYNATVTDMTGRTCVVQFNEYGNYEEVLHCDCIPITSDGQESAKNFSGSVEFRRGGNRPYVNNKNFYKPQNNK